MKASWIIRHACRLAKHKAYLFYSGRKFGVSYYRILVHDLSKLSIKETMAYSQQFFGPEQDRDWGKFREGWHHHVNRNPHHWEHWCLAGRSGIRCIRMPEKFAREMIADWMAASKAYTGSWDMQHWLCKNWATIKLHPETRAFVFETLTNAGYKTWLFPKVEE